MSFPLIIVTTYNRLAYTRRCLEALRLTMSSFRCVIVDNGSRQDTVDYLKPWNGAETPAGGRFEVVFLDTNYGVGKALNVAMKTRQRGQHVMKLDNDMIVPTVPNRLNEGKTDDRWLERTLDLLENNMENLTHIGFNSYGENFMTAHRHEFTWEYLRTTTGNSYSVMYYLGKTVLGAGVIYTSDVIDEIGLFCEDTVYGWEDNKYSNKAHRFGRGVYLLDVAAEHIGVTNPPEDDANMKMIKKESLAGLMKPPLGEPQLRAEGAAPKPRVNPARWERT
jgi:GT2 family glycosyltransferase